MSEGRDGQAAPRRFWRDQDAELRRLYAEHRSLADIAHLLHRPYESVKTRVKRLKLVRPDRNAAIKLPRVVVPPRRHDRPRSKALRKCLGACGRMFQSNGAGNRICPACTAVNESLDGGYDEAMLWVSQ